MSLLKHKKLISREDHDAACIVADLHLGLNKRNRQEDQANNAGGLFGGVVANGNVGHDDEPQAKKMAYADSDGVRPTDGKRYAEKDGAPPQVNEVVGDEWVLKPAPYYYYIDRSLETDDDPLVPVTALGRVANFPAKMHAILNDPELTEIITWCPHGRAWRILKPRQFEIRVLPHYFQHNKLSSFVRQANGWGFRRLSQGHDRNAYYHDYFLRGMEHLVKKMKRPKVAEKKSVDPEYEPDFYAISRAFPVPFNDLGKRDEDEIEMRRMAMMTATTTNNNIASLPSSRSRSNSLALSPMRANNSSSVQECLSSGDPMSVSTVSSRGSTALSMALSPTTAAVETTPIRSTNASLGSLPQSLLDALSTNPHFAAGFLAASSAHAAHMSQATAFIHAEYKSSNRDGCSGEKNDSH